MARVLIINLFCGQHKGGGYVGKLPFPDLESAERERLQELAKAIFRLCQNLAKYVETDNNFCTPFRAGGPRSSLRDECKAAWEHDSEASTELESLQREIDKIVMRSLSIPADQMKTIESSVDGRPSLKAKIFTKLPEEKTKYTEEFTASVVSYIFGVTVGRWDERCVLESKNKIDGRAPF